MTVPSDPSAGFFCEQTEDRAELCGLGIRLVFARLGAAWTHAILLGGEQELEIVRAVDSDPDRDHPARVVSPVYQELQRHQGAIDSGVCLLATGTLYQHHFSAAICLNHDADRPGGLTLDFDVADRCRSPVESLAATYTVRLDSGALARAGPDAIGWDVNGGSGGRLELEAIAPSSLAMAEAGRAATRVQILAAIDPAGFTRRLHYRWRWASNSELTR
jgi:hypothetical protein